MYPLIIISVLFFVFGFLTWANGVLIPYFQVGLQLSNFQSTWVAFSAYVAYFVMALPSAYCLKYTGYKNGMILGLVIMAVGTILFVPAAMTQIYSIFLIGLFVTGAGMTLLQTAANPYVSKIGSIESHARRIGFMGLANKIAGLCSLALLGNLFLSRADEIQENIAHSSVAMKEEILGNYLSQAIVPYLIITIVLLCLSLLIFFSNLPEVSDTADSRQRYNVSSSQEGSNILKMKNLVYGVVALFFAGACEVIPIDGIILYSSSLNIPISESRFFAQFALGAMLLGYLTSVICIPKYLSQNKALLYSGFFGLIMTLAAFFASGIISVAFVIAMGYSSAILWGTIWGIALKGLGHLTKIGAALLLMAVIGGGIFPLIFGRLIDYFNDYSQAAILVLIPCNIVLIVYAKISETWNNSDLKQYTEQTESATIN